MISVAEVSAYFDSLLSALAGNQQGVRTRVSEFYDTLAPRLAQLQRREKDRAARVAPNFNIFDFLRPNENAISRVIAELLNPEGAHGQGSIFLREFVTLIGHPGLVSRNDAVVVREQDPTDWVDAIGYIDIVVEIGDFGIGIENKPFADEGDDQLRRYCEHMSKKYGDRFCMVFLSGGIREPRSIAPEARRRLEAQGKFKVLIYEKLNNWLRHCAALSKPPRVSLILEDLQSYLGSEISILKDEEP